MQLRSANSLFLSLITNAATVIYSLLDVTKILRNRGVAQTLVTPLLKPYPTTAPTGPITFPLQIMAI